MAKIGRPLSRASKALECESRFERHVGVSGWVDEHVCGVMTRFCFVSTYALHCVLPCVHVLHGWFTIQHTLIDWVYFTVECTVGWLFFIHAHMENKAYAC